MASRGLAIPAGALSEKTEIEITPATALAPLPATAVGCGPIFDIQPAGLTLAVPATLTLPFDESKVAENYRFDDEVKRRHREPRSSFSSSRTRRRVQPIAT